MKKTVSVLCALALTAALAGCGNSSKSYSAASVAAIAQNTESAAYDSAADLDAGFGVSGETDAALPEAGDRKIIYTSQLNVETRDFEASHTLLRQAAADLGGYMESSTTYGSAENGNRSANETYRIPSEHYQEFLNSVGDIGSITYRSEQTDDITGQYVDVQARIDSLEAQRARLEELRAQADTLDDLLTIESQLSDVQYQLESYTAQRKLYDNQVDYCTVSVDLSEVRAYTPANTFSSRLSSAFGESWDGFVSFVQDVVLWLVYALPYLLVLAVLAVLARILCKHLPHRAPKAHKGAANYSALYAKQQPAAGQPEASSQTENTKNGPQ